MRIFSNILICILLINYSYSKSNELRIIAAGDIMAHLAQVKSALNKDGFTYDFNANYKFVKNYIDSADIALCNFETTLGGEHYKGFPAFSSPDTLAYAVKYAGFDIAFTANNHCLDKGSKGLERTIKILQNAGLNTTGTFLDSNDKAQRNIIYVIKNNIKIAFLNYTYGTNGIKVKHPNLVNYINRIEIKENINTARNNKADFVIVFLHWGNEYERHPNKNQIDLAKFLYENGADVIIGSHPHVVQKSESIWYEYEKNKGKNILIAYSLGNFISNQYWRYSDGGIFYDFVLNKDDKGKLWISKEKYEPVYVYKDYSEGKRKYYLLMTNYLDSYKENFKFSKTDLNKITQFHKDTEELFKK